MDWNPGIKAALDQILKTQEPQKVAVFDADGTLWHDDLGEAFFKYQIEHKLAPGLKGIADPWSHYRALCKTNTAAAYGWLAQINAGLPDNELLLQARAFYTGAFKDKINPNLRSLIQNLKNNNFEVWICTASIRWAIAPAMLDLNLDPRFLIAVDVQLDSKNRLTSKVVDPIPYRPGKKIWLDRKLPNPPLLVAGNSMGDLEMMSMALKLPLTIIFLPHLPEIKESEEGLMIEASKRGWPIQIFQQ